MHVEHPLLHVELEISETLHLEEVAHLFNKGVTLLALRVPVYIVLPVVTHALLQVIFAIIRHLEVKVSERVNFKGFELSSLFKRRRIPSAITH